MPREEFYALLFSWLRELGAFTQVTGRIASVDGQRVGIKAEGKVTTYELRPGTPVLRRLGERLQEYARVPIILGDRATLSQSQGGTAAVVVHANYDGAAFDRSSSYSNWTRSYRADDLVPIIARRNPIQTLMGIRSLGADESHRVTELEVTAEGGRTFILRGLPIRWVTERHGQSVRLHQNQDPAGMDRYTFSRKGWWVTGRDCQTAPSEWAMRGWTADQIIKRYYSAWRSSPFDDSAMTASLSGTGLVRCFCDIGIRANYTRSRTSPTSSPASRGCFEPQGPRSF